MCALVDDLDTRNPKSRMNDLDEYEQEERERANKHKLNEKFHKYSQALEEFAQNHNYTL